MIGFHQKFDQLPKLSLRGQLGGLSIIEKYNTLTAATQKKKPYLNTFHPFFQVPNYLPTLIEAALKASAPILAQFDTLKFHFSI
jgi:hypothetical protein